MPRVPEGSELSTKSSVFIFHTIKKVHNGKDLVLELCEIDILRDNCVGSSVKFLWR